MYCMKRDCYNEIYPHQDNWLDFCQDHYLEHKKNVESKKPQYEDNLKKNLEWLKLKIKLEQKEKNK